MIYSRSKGGLGWLQTHLESSGSTAHQGFHMDSYECISLEAQIKLAPSPACTLCGDGTEDALHAMRDCVATRTLWHCLAPRQLQNNFFSVGFKDWLLLNLTFNQGSGRHARWPEVMAL